MHYVHYTREINLELGGVVLAVLSLCSSLARRGHQVTVLTGDTRDVPPEWLAGETGYPQVRKIALPSMPLGPLPKETAREVSELLQQADALHLHTLWDTTNLKLAAAATAREVPYFVTMHGMLDRWAFSQQALKKKLFMKILGTRFLEKAHTVHCTAEGERRQVELLVPQSQYVVVPLYFDWELFADLPGTELARERFAVLNTDVPKVLCLSRLHPVKGADILIDAVGKLIADGTEVQLILAGPDEGGFAKQLTNQVQKLGLRQNVHLVGMVRGEEKVSLYQACDLFALPTLQENFGLVLAEAMAAGLPLVTTPHVDIWPELDEAGERITERTADAFAAAIRDMLSDPEQLAEQGEQSRKFALDWLNFDKVCQQYEEMYVGSGR